MTIAKDNYGDLAVHDGQLYAADWKSPSIHVYDCRTWQRIRSIATPCSDIEHDDDIYFHRIIVYSTGIKLSCWDRDAIYVLDPLGTLNETHGPRIPPIVSSTSASEYSTKHSELNGPRICQQDDDRAVLVADFINIRMLILKATGHWRQVKLNSELQPPKDAVWWNGKLYVSTWYDDRLTMFQ